MTNFCSEDQTAWERLRQENKDELARMLSRLAEHAHHEIEQAAYYRFWNLQRRSGISNTPWHREKFHAAMGEREAIYYRAMQRLMGIQSELPEGMELSLEDELAIEASEDEDYYRLLDRADDELYF